MGKIKHIAIIAAWAVMIPAVLFILAFANVSRNDQICSGIDIKITTNSDDPIISENEIQNIINETKEPLKGRKISNINLRSLETRIKRNPWVADVAVFPTLNGVISIKTEPREATIRIINKWGDQFYIDKSGVMYPTRPGYPVRVMVASGYIGLRYAKGINLNTIPDSVKQKSMLPSVMYLNEFISNDEFLSALIGQIYVSSNGDIELTPIAANHTIILGDTSHLENKFGKLVVFYNRVLKTRGWEKYKTVNLKFENQIVCSK